jgi:hypothetical protein
MEKCPPPTGILPVAGDVGRWVTEISCAFCRGEDESNTPLYRDVTIEQT